MYSRILLGLKGWSERCCLISNFTGFYLVLLGFTKFDGLSGFDLVVLGFDLL